MAFHGHENAIIGSALPVRLRLSQISDSESLLLPLSLALGWHIACQTVTVSGSVSDRLMIASCDYCSRCFSRSFLKEAVLEGHRADGYY